MKDGKRKEAQEGSEGVFGGEFGEERELRGVGKQIERGTTLAKGKLDLGGGWGQKN